MSTQNLAVPMNAATTPHKMRVAQGGHTIEGYVTITAGPSKGDGTAAYSLSLTEGYYVCGPHDPELNHIEVDA
jgi:hypothetical protein